MELLLKRVHDKELLNEYKDKLITIGSFTTGFFPFHRIEVHYRTKDLKEPIVINLSLYSFNNSLT